MRRSVRWRDNGNQEQGDWFPLRLPLATAKKACRDRQASSVTTYFGRLTERAMGLEPTTSSLGSWHSTN
jgi:hypothetical protein